MIDYKLAKQLKEAGFPQEGPHCRVNKDNEYGEYEVVCPYCPTLSELIEACRKVEKATGIFELNTQLDGETWCASISETPELNLETGDGRIAPHSPSEYLSDGRIGRHGIPIRASDSLFSERL